MADLQALTEIVTAVLGDDEKTGKAALVGMVATVVAAHLDQAEALKSIAHSLHKQANPPVLAQDIGLSAALLGDIAPVNATEVIERKKERVFQYFRKVIDMAAAADNSMVLLQDLRTLADELLGEI